jgi:hypothetical protein
MGGDVDGGLSQGYVKDTMIKSPSNMIAFGDVKAEEIASLIAFDANLDPTAADPGHTQWPSNRHNYYIDFAFADAHIETTKRLVASNSGPCSPTDTAWRERWNNDNLAHNGVEGDYIAPWPFDAQAAGELDPSQ